MTGHTSVRALAVCLPGERPWIAACFDRNHADIIDTQDWEDWKRKALDLCLADWEEYEIREVVLRVPTAELSALFEAEIVAEVEG